MIEIKEVTRENIAEFLKLPVKIYKNDPEWVHPIDEDEELFFSDSNPCWDNVKKKLFIAIKNKETVGRIAAFIDPFYQKIEKVGYFGCFESINDKEVAKALLNAAEQYIKQNKIKEIWGPIDGNIGHKCGLLLEHEPQIIAPLMNYHPKYYKDLMKSCKLKKLVDTLSYKIDISQVKDKDLVINQPTHIHFRPIRNDKVVDDCHIGTKIINAAFKPTKHTLFRPHKIEEAEFQWKDVPMLNNPHLAFFIYDEKKKKDCGLVLSFPNVNIIVKHFKGKLNFINKIKFIFNRNKIGEVKSDIMAVLPEYKGKGLGKLMMVKLLRNMKEQGFQTLEYSWVLETNKISRKIAEHYGGKIDKKYRIYQKKI